MTEKILLGITQGVTQRVAILEELKMSTQSLGAFIRERRKFLGLSQKQVGDELGIDQTMISKMENGSETGSIDTLILLARILKVRPGEFIDRLAGELSDKEFNSLKMLPLPDVLTAEDRGKIEAYIKDLQEARENRMSKGGEKLGAKQAQRPDSKRDK